MPLVFLPTNLSRLTEFAATEESRYALQGVHLQLLPDNLHYRLEATNGKYLAIVKGPLLGAPSGCVQDLEARASALPMDAREVLISSADWKKGLAWGGKKDACVGLCLGAQRLSFLSREAVYHATPLEGRFPEVRQCIPRLQPGSVAFRIKPEQLLPIAHLCKGLDIDALDVLYYGPEVPVGFSGRNQQGQILDCLLMPLDPA